MDKIFFLDSNEKRRSLGFDPFASVDRILWFLLGLSEFQRLKLSAAARLMDKPDADVIAKRLRWEKLMRCC